MALKEVKTTFSESKMEALDYFLREQGISVEDALKEQLTKIYEKNVPKDVRKFIESKLPAEEVVPVQEEAPAQDAAVQRPQRRTPRTGNRRAENAQPASEAAPIEEVVVQEGVTPETGMTMEM